MISDEMAFALTTHSKEITESTLNTVVNHIKSSDDKPGCSVEKIPLDYVYGHEVSHNLFMVMFKDFEIPGWIAIRVAENFMYFLNGETEEEPSEEDDDDDIITMKLSCVEPAQRFQLSPVKESHFSVSDEDFNSAGLYIFKKYKLNDSLIIKFKGINATIIESF